MLRTPYWSSIGQPSTANQSLAVVSGPSALRRMKFYQFDAIDQFSTLALPGLPGSAWVNPAQLIRSTGDISMRHPAQICGRDSHMSCLCLRTAQCLASPPVSLNGTSGWYSLVIPLPPWPARTRPSISLGVRENLCARFYGRPEKAVSLCIKSESSYRLLVRPQRPVTNVVRFERH